MNSMEIPDSLEGIAVIGLAGRFPQARNIAEFWNNLRQGVEAVTFFTDEELLAAGVSREELKLPNYVKARAVLAEADYFDASFFGFNPREAEVIDPQQRLFLECAWEAMEDAGYTREAFPGSIAVYAGATMNTYWFNNLATNPDLVQLIGNYQMMLSNNADYMPTRVSYKLNLNGPSINIQTACSTSLVTIVMACQSLLSYQCDMALAGGVSVAFPQKKGHLYQEGGIYSPDGHCRAFDAQGKGTVGGQGVGVVVLKRLEDALADGDHVYAVIKGAAVNNDGASKVGYTAPSIDGQTEVISMALALAGVDADTITYVETHGMATPLGDPIEIAGLTQAFRAMTDKKGFCAVGSVKTNIGHLDAAAGVASFIKAVLALEHKLLPPSLHYTRPNPAIDFANSPFYVNTALTEWTTGHGVVPPMPRRAGVNSFGIGGTNAHVILEEAPVVASGPSGRGAHLLVLSAKTDTALQKVTANLVAHLQAHPELNLGDVALTLQVGRKAFGQRRMVVCTDVADAVAALSAGRAGRVWTRAIPMGGSAMLHRPVSVVFAFAGQSAPYVNMGLRLYQTETVFREQVDLCAKGLRPYLGLDVREVLYPGLLRPAGEAASLGGEKLRQTAVAQAALFTVEYALARLWMGWGVQPQAMIAGGVGEFVAACLSGVFPLETALLLVAEWGKWQQNAITMGDAAASPDVASPLPVVKARLSKVTLQPPQIPIVSHAGGGWVTAVQATNPDYWARQPLPTNSFAGNLQELMKDSRWILLEVGPEYRFDTSSGSQASVSAPAATIPQTVLSSLPPSSAPDSETALVLTTLGQLWLHGLPINWAGLYTTEQRQRVSLPTYPFERQRYWIEPQKRTSEIKGELLAASSPPLAVSSPPLAVSSPPLAVSSPPLAVSSPPLTGTQTRYSRPELQTAYVAPRNDLEQTIAAIWQELLGIEPVGVQDNFFDLGGSSLLALRLFAEIEKRMGKKYPLAILLEAATVEDLARIVGDKEREISWSSLVPIQSQGSRPPFFCVHAAGGNVLVYRDLARHLGAAQPFYGLQSQGLDGTQPPLTTVEEMATLYVKEIRTVQPEGPYLLGGYCLGGTIALEMAQQLHKQGQQVAFLGLFETYNWHNIVPDGSLWGVAGFFWQKAAFNFRNFWQLDLAGKRVFMAEKMQVVRQRSKTWYGLIRSRLDRRYYERIGAELRPGQLWELNDQASLRYVPAPYTGRITHFVPKQEYTRHEGAELRWDNLAADVETYTLPNLPGGMLVEPYVAETARVLRGCIDKALTVAATS